MKNEKIITSIIVFVFASLFLALTFSFPENKTKDVGPGLLPQMYSIALYVLCILLFIQGIRERKMKNPAIHNALLVFLAMVISLAYVSIIPFVGFYFATPIIMLILLFITQIRKWLTLICVPVGTTLFIFVFFEKILKVPVPSGMFFS